MNVDENRPFYDLLGIAARARKLAFGAFATRKAIQSGKARLVVVDGSASPNTRKEFADSCKYYKVRLIQTNDVERLSMCLGKENKVVGIVCPSFAQAAWDKFSTISGGEKFE